MLSSQRHLESCFRVTSGPPVPSPHQGPHMGTGFFQLTSPPGTFFRVLENRDSGRIEARPRSRGSLEPGPQRDQHVGEFINQAGRGAGSAEIVSSGSYLGIYYYYRSNSTARVSICTRLFCTSRKVSTRVRRCAGLIQVPPTGAFIGPLLHTSTFRGALYVFAH